MTYSSMASTSFNEKLFISEVLKAIYYDYATSIDRIVARYYMIEFANDIEKKNATIENYRKTGEFPLRSLYYILYFKVNKAIDDGEIDMYYGNSGCTECDK